MTSTARRRSRCAKRSPPSGITPTNSAWTCSCAPTCSPSPRPSRTT
jgi:hypothetical protein